MAQTLIIGTKKKFHCNITGLDYMYLSDSDIDFTVHFYVNGKHNQACVEVTKANCHFVYDEGSTDSNEFHVVCNTSTLPTGQLAAVLMLTYPDIDTNQNLVENVDLKLDDTYTLRQFNSF